MNSPQPVTPACAARQLFPIGDLVATPGALALLEARRMLPIQLVARHATGDWGELCESDRRANAEALQCGSRLMSVYPLGADKVWVITEADRSVTTILLPSEY